MPNPNPPRTTPEQEETRKVYVQIMTELKSRLDAINAAAAGKVQVPSPFVREFCFLQLRLICELIALGCMAAHGNIPDLRSKSMQKEWSAHVIMQRLEKLHPKFFPHAFKIVKGIKADWHFETKPGALTKKELLEIYHGSSDALHRGGLVTFSKGRAEFDANEIRAPLVRIVELLADHTMPLLGGKHQFLCQFHTKPEGLVNVKFGLAS
jgi:hypothetical protein